jgi:Family of unknown function (DUF6092)
MGSPRPPASADHQFFELASFLVSSARGALEEGVYTASLRLIEAAGRLAAIAVDHGGDGFLRDLSDRVRSEGTTRYLESAESYTAFLDETLTAVAEEIRRRDGLDIGR